MKQKPINAHTGIYGIIGHPVRHTFSPSMHNGAFQACGVDARYLVFEVCPGSLKQAVHGLRALGVSGFNVTIPHKEAIIACLDSLDREAEIIGAVNTVKNIRGTLKGYNTDGEGFVTALRKSGVSPGGKRVVMIGAGGAARAVSVYLARGGIKTLTLADAADRRAQSLAKALKKHFPRTETRVTGASKAALSREARQADILINATPVGMKKSDPLLVDKTVLKPSLVVCDLVYNPPETRLLREAKQSGCTVMNGIGMLLYQGVAAFEIWTGVVAPTGVMKKALLSQVERKHR
ncbi:MAG: shikimate dehydrogenase [Candidatus Omnitrophica bacterium]|nr:shikimate dehydrogenase [Candidatus Omnitrophota bacterium]